MYSDNIIFFFDHIQRYHFFQNMLGAWTIVEYKMQCALWEYMELQELTGIHWMNSVNLVEKVRFWRQYSNISINKSSFTRECNKILDQVPTKHELKLQDGYSSDGNQNKTENKVLKYVLGPVSISKPVDKIY